MNNIKKVVTLLLLLCLLTILLCGCNSATPTTEDVEVTEQSETNADSVFVGEWKCLKENSCNDMEIVLTISQENGELKIVRDMESSSPSGSIITFTVDVPSEDSFYSVDTKGTYTLTDGVLQEAFESGKTNYYSATGTLSTNICEFPFCSDECGDSTYCEVHDTADKRYDSLTDSNKKSICYFIDERYDYYDSIENGYSGDKYSDTIMQEAADKYCITAEQAYIIWMNYYSY